MLVDMATLTSTLGFDDFDTICRLCLGAGQLESLFENSLNDALQTFKALTNIQIEQGDILPSKLCSNCLTYMITLKSFVDRCVTSDKTLREIAKNSEADMELDVPELIQVIQILDEEDKVVQLVTDADKNTLSSSTEQAAVLKQNSNNYRCKICAKSFSNDIYLSVHLLLHKTSNVSDADDSINVDPLNSFNDHITVDVNDSKHESKQVKMRKCEKCKENVKSLSYHYKIKKECKPQFKCTICNGILKTKSALIIHSRTHSSIKVNHKVECDICMKSFLRKRNLQRHRRTVHEKIKAFKCSHCDKPFTSAYAQKYHERRNHLVGTTMAKSTLYPCDECGQSFKSQRTLKRHQLDNKGTNKCHICDKLFPSKKVLKEHYLSGHISDKPFQCNICENSFRTCDGLRCHKRCHSNRKPYKCTYCDKSFVHSPNLKQHISTHTGERPFRCEICLQKFRRKEHLVYHERTHTGEKPYRCDICDKAFAVRGNLTAHQKVHAKERYSCDVCAQSFYDKKYLKKHVLEEH